MCVDRLGLGCKNQFMWLHGGVNVCVCVLAPTASTTADRLIADCCAPAVWGLLLQTKTTSTLTSATITSRARSQSTTTPASQEPLLAWPTSSTEETLPPVGLGRVCLLPSLLPAHPRPHLQHPTRSRPQPPHLARPHPHQPHPHHPAGPAQQLFSLGQSVEGSTRPVLRVLMPLGW